MLESLELVQCVRQISLELLHLGLSGFGTILGLTELCLAKSQLTNNLVIAALDFSKVALKIDNNISNSKCSGRHGIKSNGNGDHLCGLELALKI
jgi:hypothetical protein